MKLPNINFHENPFSGGRADTCTKTDRRADIRKLIGLFCCLCESVFKTKSSQTVFIDAGGSQRMNNAKDMRVNVMRMT